MPASPRRLSVPLFSCLVLVMVAVLGGPAVAAPDPTKIKINEVKSNPNPDFVELVNTGTEAIDITGWKAVDNDPTHTPVVITSGTTNIAPGGYFAFDPDTLPSGFGLGAADSITILQGDGTTVVDTYSWTAHRQNPSFGRCPGGTELVVQATATPGVANDCPTPDPTKVRINEVKTDPNPDFVELVNTGTQPIDITGWTAVDNEPGRTPAIIAASGTSIAPGAFYSFDPSTLTGGFGLGSGDSITVALPSGTAIDTYSWTAHRTPSFGRCPQGTGDFVANVAATPGAANSCPIPAGAENVKINEVESDPGDRIELINNGAASVDLGGYVLRDESNASIFTVPAGTIIGAGAVRAFDVNGSFGLGKGDSARLFAPGGETLLDTTMWPVDTHATTWGRCPNGTGSFTVTTPTIGLANQCGAAADPKTVIKINEVESNGDKVADWVELTNTGASTVDVSGWKILDNDPTHVATPVVVPAGTTIAPGAFYAIYTEVNQSPGFGLGGADSATLFLADGTTQVDTYAWTTHAATTYGRCPDGTGDFKTTTTSTRGAANACSAVRINEIESSAPASGPDWVELTNISETPVDISGWVVKDSTDTGSYTFPTGSTIGAKAYTTVDLGGELAGLGDTDTVRLFQPGATTPVESYAWTSPAAVTYGRCKDGVGDFVNTTAATKGAANACPGLDTEPWPGSQTVRTSDLTGTFLQDLSGLVFDPTNPDILWAAQNKLGTLFKLVRDGQNWVPDTSNSWGAGKDPKYLDGTGAPDTEGLTIGPDGFIYASSERNNSASGVSRMSILRYDPNAAGTSLTATDEWNLTSKIPAAGANLGLEGVTWVPDSFLVANGFVDQSTGAAYQPSSYPLHGTGLYVVAVEDTGALHAFALDSTGGTSHLVATITSGFPNLADVTFDPERQRLWAVTDDTHDGKVSLLKLQGGSFVVSEAYDRPVGMPNLNNEGLAISPQSRCVDGFKEVVWSDDGDTGGHSLRSGTITCTAGVPPVDPPAPDTTAPVVRVDGVVPGRLYVGTAPRPVCAATDAQSGVVSCTITQRVGPTRTTVTATATDAAGNVSRTTTSYRTKAYVVRGASYRNGEFVLTSGKAYRITGTVKASGTVYGPVRIGRTAPATKRLRGGSATIRIPRSARPGSDWKVLVRVGSTIHTVKITVKR